MLHGRGGGPTLDRSLNFRVGKLQLDWLSLADGCYNAYLAVRHISDVNLEGRNYKWHGSLTSPGQLSCC